MPAWIAHWIGVDVKQRELAGDNAGFFEKFATACIFNAFADVDEATRQSVSSLKWLILASNEEQATLFVEDDGTLIDIPGENIAVAGVPAPPKGMTVKRIDVVVRVRRA